MVPILEQKKLAIREAGGDPKVVFFHGKFNCVPHPGYLLLVEDTIDEVTRDPNIDPNEIIVIFACEPNHNIQLFGSQPFMNTLWRASLISYMNEVDGVCVVDEFTPETDIDTYWREKYKQLGVDFMSIEIDDPDNIKISKISGIEAAGGATITHDRDRVYVFPENIEEDADSVNPGDLIRIPDLIPISSTNLTSDDVSMHLLQHAIMRLQAIKYARGIQGIEKDWFN